MRRSIYLLALIMCSLLWVSCSSDSPNSVPPATVHVSNPDIVLDDSNLYMLSFTASEDWTVSVVDTSKTGWCKVFPISGKAGEGQVQITASVNDSFADRQVYIVIKAGEAEASVSVLQKMGTGMINIPIPDKEFRYYCIENFDLDNDGMISYREAQSVEEMEITSTSRIGSLKGIEYFRSLKKLVCSFSYYDSPILTLDLSANSELTHLSIDYKRIKLLDLTKLTKLTSLSLMSTGLKTLDLTHNTDLTTLQCSDNNLTTLNLSHLTKLEYLDCSQNSLTTLDVSKNTNLKELRCHRNKLTNLDTNNLDNLENLDCNNNSLQSLNTANNKKMLHLSCFSNNLTAIDISSNTALKELYCSWNSITTLDFSKNAELEHINCDYNELKTLDVSQNTMLSQLSCYGNTDLREIWLNQTQDQWIIRGGYSAEIKRK